MGFFEFRDWFYRLVLVMVFCWFGLIGSYGCVGVVQVLSDPDRGKTKTERHILSPRTTDMWSK